MSKQLGLVNPGISVQFIFLYKCKRKTKTKTNNHTTKPKNKYCITVFKKRNKKNKTYYTKTLNRKHSENINLRFHLSLASISSLRRRGNTARRQGGLAMARSKCVGLGRLHCPGGVQAGYVVSYGVKICFSNNLMMFWWPGYVVVLFSWLLLNVLLYWSLSSVVLGWSLVRKGLCWLDEIEFALAWDGDGWSLNDASPMCLQLQNLETTLIRNKPKHLRFALEAKKNPIEKKKLFGRPSYSRFQVSHVWVGALKPKAKNII